MPAVEGVYIVLFVDVRNVLRDVVVKKEGQIWLLLRRRRSRS